MTITSSGPMCDVCGNYILALDPDERINEFSCAGFRNTMHCDNKCRALVEKAMVAGDWKLLPPGPLRKVFEEQEARNG